MLGSRKLGVGSLLSIIFVILLVVAGAYLITLSGDSKDKPEDNVDKKLNLSNQFPKINTELSHKQLLDRSLKQLLNVERVSYNVQLGDVYTGTCSYDLTEGAAGRVYARVATRVDGTISDSDIMVDKGGLFIKYSRLESSTSIDVLGNYKDKWLSVSRSSGVFSTGRLPFSWLISTNAPVVIGLANAAEKKHLEQLINASAYTIKESKDTTYKGTKAVEYTLVLNQSIYNSLFKTTTLSNLRSVPVFKSAEKVYASGNNTFKATLSSENGQLLEFVVPEASGDFGVTATYNDFKYDNITLPTKPTSSVPYEEFLNAEVQ